MNEEEKKAIEMLDKFITEHKLYNIKQSDGLEDNIKIVLYLIEKLQKDNEELEEINNELEAERNEAIRRYNFETIPIQKVKDKIEELNRKIDKSIDNSKGGLDEEFIEKSGELLTQKRILQELLEEGEKKQMETM